MEILDMQGRETFGSTLAVSVNVGIALVYALEALLQSWVSVAGVFLGLVILQCFGLLFIPKSPQWLICQGREVEAEQSLRKLRGFDPNMNTANELGTLKSPRIGEELRLLRAASFCQDKAEESGFKLWREFMKPESYKPLSLLMVLFILQQLTGAFAVISYAVDILNRIIPDKSTSNFASITIGCIRMIGSILAVIFL